MSATPDFDLAPLLAGARVAGRQVLLEHEGLAVVRALGIAVPAHLFVRDAAEVAEADLSQLPGDELIVKVMADGVLHKSDVGGVRRTARRPDAVAATVAAMARDLAHLPVRGFTLNERVSYDPALGGELLLGARWTDDFGAVVTLGPGGLWAEHLAAGLAPDRATAIVSSLQAGPADLDRALAGKLLTPLLTEGLRGQAPRLPTPRLHALLAPLLELASRAMPRDISELEINPLVLTARGPVALDALVRLGREPLPVTPPRPLAKLGRLFEPRSIAFVGVSQRLNPGRIMLRNTLGQGFPASAVRIVKAGCETLEGCRCWPSLAALPEPVDLLVVSVDAEQAPAVIEEALASRAAESIILIPGGLGEVAGGAAPAARLRRALDQARQSSWQGPLVNGGNCLGIRSLPGRYDTLFIPRHKLSFPPRPAPLALISQSGAFAVARASKLAALDPRYLVSIGNQLDLTLADYLEHLAGDPEVQLFACYVEGFRPLDGARWLALARQLAAAGRPVLLYRAGRTMAGAGAAASHTASIAGDYAVTRELARAAGAVVADTLADFEDLVRLFLWLDHRPARGWGLGAVSNAGFECVTIADRLGRFHLPAFSAATRERLAALLRAARVDTIAEVRNPLDLTPILADEAFVEAVAAVLDDPAVDVAVVGCVPLTGALTTLAAGPGHGEDVRHPGSVARRLAALHAASRKPWVAVIDGGPPYDPMARLLEEACVPTFRSVDRATRLLETVCAWQREHRVGSTTGGRRP